MLYALITSEKKGGQPAAQQYLLMISLPQGFFLYPAPSIGISQDKKKLEEEKKGWINSYIACRQMLDRSMGV